METPFKLDLRNVVLPVSIERRIDRKVAKMDRLFDGIIGCHLTLSRPGAQPHKAGRFDVRLEITVPGKAIIVNRPQSENLAVAIREAFDAGIRQVEEYARMRRNNVKHHAEPPRGRIIRIFPEDGYGFIDDGLGREIYFHRNSVLGPGFEALEVGAQVRFAEEEGNEGPQARSVALL